VAAAPFVAMEKENQHVKNVRNDEAYWHVQYLISSKLVISDPSNALFFYTRPLPLAHLSILALYMLGQNNANETVSHKIRKQ
jgi:hypothetical protein